MRIFVQPFNVDNRRHIVLAARYVRGFIRVHGICGEVYTGYISIKDGGIPTCLTCLSKKPLVFNLPRKI